MKNILEITARCKELLQCSDIPARYKAVMEEKYDFIEKQLQADAFAARKCEFLALDQFEKMLQEAQRLQESPSAANAYSNLLENSVAIVRLLSQNS